MNEDKERPINKGMEEEWWEHTNELCKTCKQDCKQSSKVELDRCPQYEKED